MSVKALGEDVTGPMTTVRMHSRGPDSVFEYVEGRSKDGRLCCWSFGDGGSGDSKADKHQEIWDRAV